MRIDPSFIAIWLVVGVVSGTIARFIAKEGSLGLIGDAMIGLIGAAVAGYLLPGAGVYIGTGFIPEIVNGTIGAIVLLVLARLVKGMLPSSA